ncbi:MAG: hypothetical protein KGJ89_00595 [Patescibacteria group bacterium]|nr:hypothetical protein [Patescibacteria group bacterium]MDE2015013.1 hypothetical protein [Patescibacteria group bacterium]MDE2226441.1 hypothetical protein [Patescibacteria group bacterium]
MVQQQLVDYIKEQLKLGVDASATKAALVDAGWPSADVEDSLGEISGGGKQAAVSDGQAATSKDMAAKSNAPIVANFGLPSSQQAPIIVSDLLGSTQLNMAAKATADKNNNKPETANKILLTKKMPGMSRFTAPTIIMIVLGVVAVALAAGDVYLYLQDKSFQQKITAFSSSGDAVVSNITALNSQIADLKSKNGDLASQVSSLQKDNQGLIDEISFVGVPSGSTSTEDLAFSVSGVLAGGGQVQYNLTTKNGIKIYVKNYKDAKVDAALKPFVNQTVSLSGTHAPGSRDATITAVNGSDISTITSTSAVSSSSTTQ